MRKALVLLAVLTLAGCGGTRTVTHTVTTPVPAVNGHQCEPGHFFMQCALGDQVPPAPQLFSAPFGIQQGVDFTSAPACSALRAAGFRFGASYVSFDAWKNWTRSAVDSYHHGGCGTVTVWETTATRAATGFAAGVADAHSAYGQARALGNTAGAITFAIDFDASGPQVASYFRGVHSVLGDRGNAYGGYFPLQYLCANGLVGHLNWQTYAWSGGRWLPASCAPLEQWSNDHVVAGHSVDFDRALLPNYGQFPAPAPPPASIHCFGRHYEPRRHAKVCDQIRPLTSRRSRARDSSRRVLAGDLRLQRYELGIIRGYRCTSRHPRSNVCPRALRIEHALEAQIRVMRHRADWFAIRVKQAIHQYG